MNELSTGTKGAISELRVASHLMGLGFQVFKNLSMHGSCDLVAISRRGRVIKIQVKSTLSINSFKNLRVGQNDLLAVIVGGEIYYRAINRRVQSLIPGCALARRPVRPPAKQPEVRHSNSQRSVKKAV